MQHLYSNSTLATSSFARSCLWLASSLPSSAWCLIWCGPQRCKHALLGTATACRQLRPSRCNYVDKEHLARSSGLGSNSVRVQPFRTFWSFLMSAQIQTQRPTLLIITSSLCICNNSCSRYHSSSHWIHHGQFVVAVPRAATNARVEGRSVKCDCH